MTSIKRLQPYLKKSLGGGYIYFDPEHKVIHIYGTSMGFGPADHNLTARMLRKAYPGHIITTASPNEWWPDDKHDGKYAPIHYPWELDKEGNFKNRYYGED